MDNRELFNKLLNRYNQKEALRLLNDELGLDRTQYELDRFSSCTLTKSVFIELSQEFAFFWEYINDENYKEYKIT